MFIVKIIRQRKTFHLIEYLLLWKDPFAFKNYIPSKRGRYGLLLYMVFESGTGYFYLY